jgi:hypothetical protein
VLQNKVQQLAHGGLWLRRPLLFIAVLAPIEALGADRDITKHRRIRCVIVRDLALQHQRGRAHQKGQRGVTCQLTASLCVCGIYPCQAYTFTHATRVRRYPARRRCACGASCLVTVWVSAATRSAERALCMSRACTNSQADAACAVLFL